MSTRYPRTPHLPWSPGATSDDVRREDLSAFVGREVVITEKLDGENTTMLRDRVHARSPDSAHHPSRAWMKSFHDRVRLSIPEGFRVCGENVFARHSVGYAALESFFYLFSVWDDHDACLDWEATVRFGKRIGAPVPRVLFRGVFDEKKVRALTFDTSRVEGYVVRTTAGFSHAAFADHVAKWVRTNHVTTDRHWMLGPVVENVRSPRSVLWDARGGVRVDATALSSLLPALATSASSKAFVERANERLDRMASELDGLDRSGDVRLEGVLAALTAPLPRAAVLSALIPPLGARIARRTADLVGLHGALRRPFPDEDRANGLRRMALASDVGALHALARATLPDGGERRVEADLVEWSSLHAEALGLLSNPIASLREAARAALADLEPRRARRVWGAMRDAWVLGKIASVEEGLAATFDLRSRDVPSVIVMVGPSGSGKSTLVPTVAAGHAVVSLDDLRAARGDRGDQTANEEILASALACLEAHLADRRDVVWDATSLVPMQRKHVLERARRRDALATLVVLAPCADEVRARNARRAHPVPSRILDEQLDRFWPPYPGEAPRILYAGATGVVDDTAGDPFTDEREDPRP